MIPTTFVKIDAKNYEIGKLLKKKVKKRKIQKMTKHCNEIFPNF